MAGWSRSSTSPSTGRLPPRDWLAELFAEAVLAEARAALLFGRPPGAPVDKGPMVCACLKVGAKAVARRHLGRGRTAPTPSAPPPGAGTNCGSCRPEIARMIAATARLQQGARPCLKPCPASPARRRRPRSRRPDDVRAVRAVESAQALLYDALVSDEAIALAPPGCVRIQTGKRAGKPSMHQDEINRLMLRWPARACGSCG
jgi:bacterioferritin-associated ferredoxin